MTTTPSPVALLSAEERAEVITDWKVANGYDDFLKAYCDAVDRVNALTAEHAALTAALATRDAELAAANALNKQAIDTVLDHRDECKAKVAEARGERDAALRDLAEARAQLATRTAERDRISAEATARLRARDTFAADAARAEDALAACRRERNEAQKASLAPLLLRLAVAPRFWTKVNLNGPVPPHKPRLGKCWIWTASTSSGYGKFKAGYKWHRAHRFSYECATGTVIATGDDPQDTSVMHLCDNTLCVNPRHLALGTHLDNVRDCVKKGRNRPYRGGPFAGKKAANE